MVSCGGLDQRGKVFFPHPHQDALVMPDGGDGDWSAQWRAMDPQVRALMRTYTVREHRRDANDLDSDFAVHGPDGGPVTQWALRATAGNRIGLLGPVVENNGGFDFQPPWDTGWVLLTADETALPAVETILSWLPAETRVRAWIEVACAEDIRGLSTQAQAEITWLVRDTTAVHAGNACGAEEVSRTGEIGNVREAGNAEDVGRAVSGGEGAVVAAVRLPGGGSLMGGSRVSPDRCGRCAGVWCADVGSSTSRSRSPGTGADARARTI